METTLSILLHPLINESSQPNLYLLVYSPWIHIHGTFMVEAVSLFALVTFSMVSLGEIRRIQWDKNPWESQRATGNPGMLFRKEHGEGNPPSAAVSTRGRGNLLSSNHAVIKNPLNRLNRETIGFDCNMHANEEASATPDWFNTGVVFYGDATNRRPSGWCHATGESWKCSLIFKDSRALIILRYWSTLQDALKVFYFGILWDVENDVMILQDLCGLSWIFKNLMQLTFEEMQLFSQLRSSESAGCCSSSHRFNLHKS